MEGERLPQSAVSKDTPARTPCKEGWPLIWPGMILAGISMVANLGVAIMLETGDLDINLYPELFTVPVFIYWLFILFKLHATLKKVSNGQYPIGPVQASVSMAFAGSPAFYLAGFVMAPIAHMLFLITKSGPDNYQIFMKSGGLMLITGVIIASYCFAGLYTTLVIFRTFGTLSKFGVQNGLEKSVLSRYIVASALIAPAMLLTVNAWGSYTNFLLFLAGHSLSFLLCFLCVAHTIKKFRTVDWTARRASLQAVPGLTTDKGSNLESSSSESVSPGSAGVPYASEIPAESDGEKLKLSSAVDTAPVESEPRPST